MAIFKVLVNTFSELQNCIALVGAKSTILEQHPESNTFGVILPWNTLNNSFSEKGHFFVTCYKGQRPTTERWFLLDYSSLVLPADCTEGSYSSNIVIFHNFLVFKFSLFQFQTIASTSFAFFLDKNSSIFNVVTHKSWVYHRLNAFKILRMVYYNQKISDNLDQQCKVHSPFSHLFNFLELLIIASTDHS